MELQVKLFIDTEFTSFNAPKLLSLGLVAEDSREFYVEVNSETLHRSANEFVKEIVLPQFGVHPAAVSVPTAAAAGAALADFLVGVDGRIHLVADHPVDFEFALDILKHARRWDQVSGRLFTELVANEVCTDDLQPVWDASFEKHERAAPGLFKHHALLDARVLKDVYDQVHAPA